MDSTSIIDNTSGKKAIQFLMPSTAFGTQFGFSFLVMDIFSFSSMKRNNSMHPFFCLMYFYLNKRLR